MSRSVLAVVVLALGLGAQGAAFGAGGGEPRPGSSEEEELRTRVYAWRDAWQSLDVDRFMFFYDLEFQGQGLDYRRWRAKKTRLFRHAGELVVEISVPEITLEEGRATARFAQRYRSDTLSDLGMKELTFVESDGDWKIVSESWRPLAESVAKHLFEPQRTAATEGVTDEAAGGIPAAKLPFFDQGEKVMRLTWYRAVPSEDGMSLSLEFETTAPLEGTVSVLVFAPEVESDLLDELMVEGERIRGQHFQWAAGQGLSSWYTVDEGRFMCLDASPRQLEARRIQLTIPMSHWKRLPQIGLARKSETEDRYDSYSLVSNVLIEDGRP